jgi:sterol desaturase/sphingolipid hydroxylase (fatty acid hydroxylase superfamily)
MSHELNEIAHNVARLCLWLVLLSAIFVPLERFFALRERKILRPMLWQDLGYFFLNGLITGLILSAPISVIITLTRMVVPGAYYAAIEALPLWLHIGGAFLVGEIGYYWGHRWMHSHSWLWHFHAVHHQPDGLDWLVNTRAHLVDIIFTRLCGLMPLYALGFGSATSMAGTLGPVLFTLFGTVWSFFIHANLRWKLGPLEHIISSPHFHHWHHSRDTHTNHNFAPMLPFVDRMFGTLHLPRNEWPSDYGIRNTAEGVSPPRTAKGETAGPPPAE